MLFVLYLTFLARSWGEEIASLAAHSASSHDVLSQQQSYFATKNYCYKTFCRCSQNEADCSNNHGRLGFIPKLPRTVTFVNFSYNSVIEIQNYTFFQNVTWITDLSLNNNGLMHVDSGAFRLLTKLLYLSVSYNYLNNSALPAVLSIKPLQKLEFVKNLLSPLADDTFHTYHLPNLKALNLRGNYLGESGPLNLSVFVPLQSLENLRLQQNRVSDILTDHLNTLRILDLRENSLEQLPTTCGRDGASLFPQLHGLMLGSNSISHVRGDICLPVLRKLDLSQNFLVQLDEEHLHVRAFPNLIELFLEDMKSHIKNITENAFQSESLMRLSLKFNRIYFKLDAYHPRCFAGCPELNDLQLGMNNFRGMSHDKWDQLFRNLSKLHLLYLEHAYIDEVPPTFVNIKSLRKVSMGSNNVATIPDGVFDTQPNLTDIRLDDNQITVIRETTFSALTRQRLSYLDLSGNPIICSCEVMWFRDWLVSNPQLFNPPWYEYQCSNIANTNLTSFNMAEQACLMDRGTYRFITASVSIMISTATLLTLLYRYRWHLRLVMYEAFRGQGEARRLRLQRRDFFYDVFVSYAGEDQLWVREHLAPVLEEGLGLRLCLHERDFIPGQPILKNIEESVQSSKKVLMLFSTNFAHSQWCQFELTLCLSHVMEYEDALLVVMLHDVPAHDLTSAMMAVLRTTTYIEWVQDPDGVASFWGRLQIALQEILHAGQRPELY